MVFPSPPHAGQVCVDCIWPRKVLVTWVTCPVPRQVAHVEYDEPFLAPVPSHEVQGIYLLTLIFFSTPWAISFRSTLTFTLRLLPFLVLAADLLLPPNPPKEPNASPKISPKLAKISSMVIPPPPKPLPAPPETPACPKRS